MRVGGEGIGNPLKYSCLGNPVYRGGGWAIVLGTTMSQTRLSVCAFTYTHTHTHIYICVCVCIYTYVYVYGEREH